SPSAVTAQLSTLPIDSDQLEQPFVFIAKGLLYWHWEISLGTADSAITALITDAAGAVFDWLFFVMKPRGRFDIVLGDETFSYHGLQGEPPQLSLWKFTVYGGVQLAGDPNAPGHTSSHVYAVTGPNAVVDHMKTSVFARNNDAGKSVTMEAIFSTP